MHTQGPISLICIPPVRGVERSPLSAGGLFLSGSVGADIKIWDYQVRALAGRSVARVYAGAAFACYSA